MDCFISDNGPEICGDVFKFNLTVNKHGRKDCTCLLKPSVELTSEIKNTLFHGLGNGRLTSPANHLDAAKCVVQVNFLMGILTLKCSG
jgi:hypothetical protein